MHIKIVPMNADHLEELEKLRSEGVKTPIMMLTA